MSTLTLQLVCPQERVAIGTLEVEPDETITARLIREHLDAVQGRRDDAIELRGAVRDGEFPQCPRCSAMLMIGLASAPVDDVVADNFLVLVGSAQYQPGGER